MTGMYIVYILPVFDLHRRKIISIFHLIYEGCSNVHRTRGINIQTGRWFQNLFAIYTYFQLDTFKICSILEDACMLENQIYLNKLKWFLTRHFAIYVTKSYFGMVIVSFGLRVTII